MTTSRTPILFLSGAGLPAWIWDEVRAALSVESAVAAYPRVKDNGPREYAQRILDDVDWSEFFVVAHSIGGVVARAVVDQAPDRVAGLLAVAATVPEPAESFLRAQPAPQRWVLATVLRLVGTKPPDGAIRSVLGRGLPAATASRLVADFAPEPLALYRRPGGDAPIPAHSRYIVTTDDPDTPRQRQEVFAKGFGSTREIATGHLPMLQDPAGLAALIDEFRREAGPVR
ncbi:alpha/beta hydrolase [Microbacteriaceae bacterium VKM Ac-2854]|nr:alpha/beta hydrolase [Microbacteriaceae bacterium VKM Ac-2854]